MRSSRGSASTRASVGGWPFRAQQRLAGLHLRATDTKWERGEGPLVEGTALTLLLLLTGRTEIALPMLNGPGVTSIAG